LKQAEDKWGLVSHFYREVEKEVGEKKAMEIAQRAFIAELSEGIEKDLEGFEGKERFDAWKKELQRRAELDPNIRVLEVAPDKVCIEVTRCSTEEALRKLGLIKLCQAYCDSDFESAKAIHPQVRMTRDKTIAYGDAYCNHCWVWD